MRMNDYEWDFVQDSIDKKNVARSARSTRTHCGKRGTVKFPSDYMSKKELKAMNGDVIQYASLKNPMNWAEFKELPNDLKKEYLMFVRDRFGAPDKYIAEMFGVSGNTLSLYLKDLNLGAGNDSGNGRRKWEKESFYAWRSGIDDTADVPAVTEETGVEGTEVPETDNPSCTLSDTEGVGVWVAEKTHAIPECGKMLFNCPADQALNMLAMVLGNTKVRLSIEWDVLEE